MISSYHEEKRQRRRVMMLTALSLVMLGSLAVTLFGMQVRQRDHYEGSLSRQSIRRVRLPAQRGRIFDRNGRLIAHNRPSYELVLYLEELRRPGPWANTVREVMSVLDDLTVLMGEPALPDEDRVRAHIHQRLPLPLVAWRDLNPRQMARFAERRRDFAGVDIQPAPIRDYPLSPAACHVLGYVGRADPAQDDKETGRAFYLPEFEGKAGIEAQYDELLRGKAGGRLIRVDAAGYRWEDMSERPAVAGSDIQLTLDMVIQQLVEHELADVQGAAVVLDPRNGDVLAMASSPNYDHNRFVPVILTSDWEALRRDERSPMLNRAIAGRYPPASTVKPLVAMGALINGIMDAGTRIECTGSYNIGPGASIRCWRRQGHGMLVLQDALKHSCNPFFIDIAIRGGYGMLLHQAAAVGLGRRTGIDLPFESPGLLPDDTWKRRTQGDGWRTGDTANVAIGQGALLVTPLQMALMASALANGGRIWQPRLAMGIWDADTRSMNRLPPRLINDIEWPPDMLRTIRHGLRDVVQARDGTAYRARVPGFNIAGKSGTAEVGPKHLDQKHGWMIAYAPFERPRYAVAMVVEDAESGGITVAPRIKRLMEHLLAGEGL